LFPNNFQCTAVQRGWSAGIMYIRGLAGLPGERGRAGWGRRTGGWSGAARGRGAVTAILFSGVIFYQHRQPSALTNPSTLSARPLYGSPLAIPRTIRPPAPPPTTPSPPPAAPHRRTCTDRGGLLHLRFLLRRLFLLVPPRTPHGGHPLPPRAAPPPHPLPPTPVPTNLATVSVLNHICDAFFSFLFFHKAGL